MILSLTIENFYSVSKAQLIDLRASANVAMSKQALRPAWPGASEYVPTVVALFGPNGAGKSTILRALTFIFGFVSNSFRYAPKEVLPFTPFFGPGPRRSTRLSLSFSGPASIDQEDRSKDQCPYTYSIELGLLNAQSNIILERLEYRPPGSARALRVFERRGTDVKSSAKFGLRKFRSFLTSGALRPNASLISTLAQVQHPLASFLAEAGGKLYSNILMFREDDPDNVVIESYSDEATLMSLRDKITRFDTGIQDVRIDNSRETPRALFKHHGLVTELDFVLESHGTRELFRLYPLIYGALDSGSVACIDDLDSALHPLILSEIVRMFHSPVTNPKNAQLWITCQNPAVLDDLEKEEIFFCEKDADGQTGVYSLCDIKGVRRDDNYYKKYLTGIYGAIPKIG